MKKLFLKKSNSLIPRQGINCNFLTKLNKNGINTFLNNTEMEENKNNSDVIKIINKSQRQDITKLNSALPGFLNLNTNYNNFHKKNNKIILFDKVEDDFK